MTTNPEPIAIVEAERDLAANDLPPQTDDKAAVRMASDRGRIGATWTSTIITGAVVGVVLAFAFFPAHGVGVGH
ncbi:hypothetical protein [Agromyces humi]|uniref:hypothetical protein n=1 Tax=Agromyces humi TaxID=1766800 RepID=UPI00135C0145|nr:hypothetical protein [Agromyces humi]